MPPYMFVIKWLHISVLRGPWEGGHFKSGIKHALCKACQSLPFMITAEVEKKHNKTKQNKTTKYEFKHLIDGTHWLWPGTYH